MSLAFRISVSTSDMKILAKATAIFMPIAVGPVGLEIISPIKTKGILSQYKLQHFF